MNPKTILMRVALCVAGAISALVIIGASFLLFFKLKGEFSNFSAFGVLVFSAFCILKLWPQILQWWNYGLTPEKKNTHGKSNYLWMADNIKLKVYTYDNRLNIETAQHFIVSGGQIEIKLSAKEFFGMGKLATNPFNLLRICNDEVCTLFCNCSITSAVDEVHAKEVNWVILNISFDDVETFHYSNISAHKLNCENAKSSITGADVREDYLDILRYSAMQKFKENE